jgi:hypothetical protein
MSSIEEKLNLLPPQVKKEALDFIEFLIQKYIKNTSTQIAESNENEYWLKLSEKSVEKIWDNPEDEVYNELLKR